MFVVCLIIFGYILIIVPSLLGARKGLGVSEILSAFLLPAVHRRISTFHVADCPLNLHIPFAPQQPLAYEPRFSQMTEE